MPKRSGLYRRSAPGDSAEKSRKGGGGTAGRPGGTGKSAEGIRLPKLLPYQSLCEGVGFLCHGRSDASDRDFRRGRADKGLTKRSGSASGVLRRTGGTAFVHFRFGKKEGRPEDQTAGRFGSGGNRCHTDGHLPDNEALLGGRNQRSGGIDLCRGQRGSAPQDAQCGRGNG